MRVPGLSAVPAGSYWVIVADWGYHTAIIVGRFFPASGRYLWTRDCNWWTVMRLDAAHLASGANGVLSRQVKGHLRGFRAAEFTTPAS